MGEAELPGRYDPGIHERAPHEGRPWIGYGDGDEAWTQERTDPRAIQGNACTLEGTVWTKHRSILGGEHVQDVAGWRGCACAAGSGADLRSWFEAGEVFRYLWVSFDAGATFVTVERLAYPEAGGGHTRWVHLLPTADTLHLFEYARHATTGEMMVLAAPGDAYPAEEAGVWDLSVLVATTGSPAAWTEVATYQARTAARAIAFWEHALFLGTADGRVLRASDRR